jgi:hypothetical protein
MLNYRYAVLTENTVMLRGLGGNLGLFSDAMPGHTRSILHTRNSAAAKDIKFMYIPFHVANSIEPFQEVQHQSDSSSLSIPVINTAKTNNKRVSFAPDLSGPYGFLNATFTPHPVHPREIVPKVDTKICGYVPVWCATESTILILYGLKLEMFKRFFKYSIKANKLFSKGSKYRDKGKKGNNWEDRHLYAEVSEALVVCLSVCLSTRLSVSLSACPHLCMCQLPVSATLHVVYIFISMLYNF